MLNKYFELLPTVSTALKLNDLQIRKIDVQHPLTLIMVLIIIMNGVVLLISCIKDRHQGLEII